MAQVYDASLLTQEAYAAAKATAGAIITGMSQNSVQVYLKAANHAAARVGVVGEQAMKEDARKRLDQAAQFIVERVVNR